MNDNQNVRGVRVFHVVFMIFSGGLILFGLFLAGTMIYGVHKMAKSEAAGIGAVVRDENTQTDVGGPMPQMHSAPYLFGEDEQGTSADSSGIAAMNSVEDEQKDDLSLPLFDHEAQEGGEEKPLELVPVYPEEDLKP